MKQIIAIGSGGMDGKNPSIELYILAQSKKQNPKILFLPTPSGDDGGYIKYFMEYFGRFPCEPSYLSLFSPPNEDLEKLVLSNDIVFVSGGHSRNALVLWQSWKMNTILQKAYDNGVILSGGSAGSVVWFDECITDSVPGKLTVMPCLGILPYSNCPHYTSKHRQQAYSKEMLNGNIKNGYAIDDDAALHFIDGNPVRSISIRDQSKSFYCHTNDDTRSFIQDEIETRSLNKIAMEELVWSSKTFSHLV
jgi:peptidase E